MPLVAKCFEIFFARILDVSLSTVRTTFVLRGKTLTVAIIAFFEITIWLLVAREALNGELNAFIVLSYSGGYTTGTILGTVVTNKFIKTTVEIMIISNVLRNGKKIKAHDFGVSIINKDKHQVVLLVETSKKRLDELINLVKSLDNDAFITIKETKTIINGYM